MRLYDTATRGLRELPPPPGPIRMYFCGPTVYQRIHVGNARPFVLSMWLKRWLERTGYDVTLVENITDVNDKIYAAAPGDSARLAEDASGWYVEDTGSLGLGRPELKPRPIKRAGEFSRQAQRQAIGSECCASRGAEQHPSCPPRWFRPFGVHASRGDSPMLFIPVRLC